MIDLIYLLCGCPVGRSSADWCWRLESSLACCETGRAPKACLHWKYRLGFHRPLDRYVTAWQISAQDALLESSTGWRRSDCAPGTAGSVWTAGGLGIVLADFHADTGCSARKEASEQHRDPWWGCGGDPVHSDGSGHAENCLERMWWRCGSTAGLEGREVVLPESGPVCCAAGTGAPV